MSTSDKHEVAPGTSRQELQGTTVAGADEAELRSALEKAFDYRGDITITLRSGERIEGYVFDRRTGPTLATSFVRVIPAGAEQKMSISFADVAALTFSGRDTAAGKSWEAWVRQYWQKRSAGETGIGIAAEPLE